MPEELCIHCELQVQVQQVRVFSFLLLCFSSGLDLLTWEMCILWTDGKRYIKTCIVSKTVCDIRWIDSVSVHYWLVLVSLFWNNSITDSKQRDLFSAAKAVWLISEKIQRNPNINSITSDYLVPHNGKYAVGRLFGKKSVLLSWDVKSTPGLV